MRPIVDPSGETTPSFEPVIDVTFVRAPPSTDIVYKWRSPGWTSVVVR